MTRDPIGEAGGGNLYGAMGNNPLNIRDLFGLKEWSEMTQQERNWAWMDYEAKKRAGIPAQNPANQFNEFDACICKCMVEAIVGYVASSSEEEGLKIWLKKYGNLSARKVIIKHTIFFVSAVIDADTFYDCVKEKCRKCKK
jgi:hypothetical protein